MVEGIAEHKKTQEVPKHILIVRQRQRGAPPCAQSQRPWLPHFMHGLRARIAGRTRWRDARDKGARDDGRGIERRSHGWGGDWLSAVIPRRAVDGRARRPDCLFFWKSPSQLNWPRLRLSAAPSEASAHRDRLLMGYTWRWWPPLARVRELLAEGAIGRLLHVQFHMSAHLADWHPWERYQDFFMASRALGGGALLDESHWIDLMLWLVGKPDWVVGEVSRISDLEIETDDNVDVLAGFIDGTRVTLHLDLYGRPHEKSICFQGTEGTLLWSDDPSRIAIGRGAAKEWEEETFACERNDMFLAVAREFLDVLGGKPPVCLIEDGVRVLEVVEAARRANKEGCAISLERVS